MYHQSKQIGAPDYLHPQSDQKREEWYEIQARAEDVARHASTRKVRLLVDAEQTNFQLAIRDITINSLMPKYNKEMAAIYNTQQCYLKVCITKSIYVAGRVKERDEDTEQQREGQRKRDREREKERDRERETERG